MGWCRGPSSGHGHLAGAHEVHATTLKITEGYDAEIPRETFSTPNLLDGIRHANALVSMWMVILLVYPSYFCLCSASSVDTGSRGQ